MSPLRRRWHRSLVLPQLIVPAYFHPATHPAEWEWLAGRAAEIRMVVLNLANGPGAQPDPVIFPVLDRLRAAGAVPWAGTWTPTTASARSMRDHLGHQPARELVSGERVFFDRAAVAADQVGHYAYLAQLARDIGAHTVALNHGAHPVDAYAEHADLLGTFEGPWTAYSELAVPRWVRARPAGLFYHLLHSVPASPSATRSGLRPAQRGLCVLTDRGGANPWDRLPVGVFDSQTR